METNRENYKLKNLRENFHKETSFFRKKKKYKEIRIKNSKDII